MQVNRLQTDARADHSYLSELANAIVDNFDVLCFSAEGEPERLYLRNGDRVISWARSEFEVSWFDLCRFLQETVLANVEPGSVLYFDEENPIWREGEGIVNDRSILIRVNPDLLERAQQNRQEIDLRSAIAEFECKPREDFWAHFSSKNADLNPEGGYGVKRVLSIDDERVTIEVVAYATIHPPYEYPRDDEQEETNEAAKLFVLACGYHADWTGDDWSLSQDWVIGVQWRKTNDAIDYAATAKAIAAISASSVRSFKSAMVKLNDAIDALPSDD